MVVPDRPPSEPGDAAELLRRLLELAQGAPVAPGARVSEFERGARDLLAGGRGDAPLDGASLDSRGRSTHAEIDEVIATGCLRSVFQPVLELSSGRVAGFEALSRFASDARRPDQWFAEAAEVGRGIELELLAVRSALAHLPAVPLGAYLAVNASPQLLASVGFRTLMSETPRSRVMVELTEHTAVTDYDRLLDAVDELRSYGVRLAIDDVGAGFSSFAHVLRMRPDVLKVDISITRSIDSDPARRGLTRGIVQIAREIGATVVAEGVETQAEFDCLVTLGLDAVQGYFIARPGRLDDTFALPAATPGTVRDVDQASIEADVRRLAETRFELALLHSPIGVAVVGLDGEFLHTNPALQSMLGYSGPELAELTFQELTVEGDLEADLTLLRQCLSGQISGYRIDKRYHCRDGSQIWGDLSVVVVKGTEGAPLYFISQVQDITERKRLENRLEIEARTDWLTGVLNRTGGRELLERIAAESRSEGTSFGVCFCDLRGFKSINDDLGHEVGDRVLRIVAGRLVDASRPGDVVVRWGGDEFVVILRDIHSAAEVDAVATRLAAAVDRDTALLEGHAVRVSLSIGGVWCPRDAPQPVDVDAVVREADQRMYRSRTPWSMIPPHPR